MYNTTCLNLANVIKNTYMIQSTDGSRENLGFSVFQQFDLLVARIEIGSNKVKALAGLACATVALGFPVGVVVAGGVSAHERQAHPVREQKGAAASLVQKCVEYSPSNPDC